MMVDGLKVPIDSLDVFFLLDLLHHEHLLVSALAALSNKYQVNLHSLFLNSFFSSFHPPCILSFLLFYFFFQFFTLSFVPSFFPFFFLFFFFILPFLIFSFHPFLLFHFIHLPTISFNLHPSHPTLHPSHSTFIHLIQPFRPSAPLPSQTHLS